MTNVSSSIYVVAVLIKHLSEGRIPLQGPPLHVWFMSGISLSGFYLQRDIAIYDQRYSVI